MNKNLPLVHKEQLRLLLPLLHDHLLRRTGLFGHHLAQLIDKLIREDLKELAGQDHLLVDVRLDRRSELFCE